MGTPTRGARGAKTDLSQLVYREQDAPMTSRDAILAAVRANAPPPRPPIPAIPLFERTSRPMLEKFQETLMSMGGKIAPAPDGGDHLDAWVRSLFPDAAVI